MTPARCEPVAVHFDVGLSPFLPISSPLLHLPPPSITLLPHSHSPPPVRPGPARLASPPIPVLFMFSLLAPHRPPRPAPFFDHRFSDAACRHPRRGSGTYGLTVARTQL
ncbi:hypothetical protein M427DRAFT_350260 [Gonapodya prolifera JEL478]|uniref:Uncharacterized protein n=1 Tax=Gonapodya prolifera (strain JEL478) TaxID=1344416 RepID=A0A139AW95_GONPJ|nr:hypothetical protein M427DRAFT_350260 [Gonapodya prolifera JEL478]|eukprot:KXS21006.1 hypothetical protein M427DRAFT_350260 [Gonapodya prolifera JEL478]